MRLISVYLVVGEGVSKTNVEIIEELVLLLLACRYPWCLADDLNITPKILASTGCLKKIGGVFLAAGATLVSRELRIVIPSGVLR